MVSTATSNRRLLKLAAFLDTVPRKRFDYSKWVGDNWKGAQDLRCGTTGCALGWAATMPTFRRLGLRLVALRHDSTPDDPGEFEGLISNPRLGLESNEWWDYSIDAGAATFGVDYEEAEYLFSPCQNGIGPESPGPRATPQQVAAHIRGFVERRGNGAG